MSFDLCVFNRSKAPKKKEKFVKWYENVTCWKDDSTHDDASVATKDLQKWYEFMLQYFPALNGHDAQRSMKRYTDFHKMNVDEAIDHCADYSIDKDLIYVSFGNSQAKQAFQLGINKARELGLGFYDPQKDRIFQCGGFVHDPHVDFCLSTGNFKEARKKYRKNVIALAVLIVACFSFGILFDKHLSQYLFMGTILIILLCLKFSELHKFKVAEAEYQDSIWTEFRYQDLAEWIDSSLNTNLSDDIKCFCFNIYDDGDNDYSIEIAGYAPFYMNGEELGTEQMVINRDSPFVWNTPKSPDEILSETKHLIGEYLRKGRYGSLLCSTEAVLAGFVDGDTHIISRCSKNT